MSPSDRQLVPEINRRLDLYSRENRALPGVELGQRRAVFVGQLIESIRRVNYIAMIRARKIFMERRDPDSEFFDPLKASIFHHRAGDIDEAFWLVFLSVHFGRHSRAGWRLCRDVYGSLGGQPWTWERISQNPAEFRRWLRDNMSRLRSGDVLRRFGNHRKYLSLNAESNSGTGAAFSTYVNWVQPFGTHEQLVKETHERAGRDPGEAFDMLYHSMATVATFGRTARFDYLTMLAKLGLAPIEPASPYLLGATGPYQGARLLFGRDETSRCSREELDDWVVELGHHLNQGMQVMEDALCNWQKSPDRFVRFRG